MSNITPKKSPPPAVTEDENSPWDVVDVPSLTAQFADPADIRYVRVKFISQASGVSNPIYFQLGGETSDFYATTYADGSQTTGRTELVVPEIESYADGDRGISGMLEMGRYNERWYLNGPLGSSTVASEIYQSGHVAGRRSDVPGQMTVKAGGSDIKAQIHVYNWESDL